eukprot:m.27843 g.27843  ORF g.27843 m.27843 type:complete len:98 (+) comp10339_c0_seq1:119-412(+)
MDAFAVAENNRQLQACRTLSAILFGVAAGVLALTSWHGFLFFIISSFFLSSYLNLIIGSKSKDYFSSPSALWFDGIAGNAFTFVLFWTLTYGLVHVY